MAPVSGRRAAEQQLPALSSRGPVLIRGRRGPGDPISAGLPGWSWRMGLEQTRTGFRRDVLEVGA